MFDCFKDKFVNQVSPEVGFFIQCHNVYETIVNVTAMHLNKVVNY